jgi:hypothetical protein
VPFHPSTLGCSLRTVFIAANSSQFCPFNCELTEVSSRILPHTRPPEEHKHYCVRKSESRKHVFFGRRKVQKCEWGEFTSAIVVLFSSKPCSHNEKNPSSGQRHDAKRASILVKRFPPMRPVDSISAFSCAAAKGHAAARW